MVLMKKFGQESTSWDDHQKKGAPSYHSVKVGGAIVPASRRVKEIQNYKSPGYHIEVKVGGVVSILKLKLSKRKMYQLSWGGSPQDDHQWTPVACRVSIF